MDGRNKREYIHRIYAKSAVVHAIKINEDQDLRCIENCASESTGRARNEVVKELSL